MSGRSQHWTNQSVVKQDRMVFGSSLSQRSGSNRRGADGVRVEKFPRIHNIADPRRDSRDDWIKVWTWALPRKDHLHVKVQWQWLEQNEETKKMYCECSQSYLVWSKIHAKTLVISRTWIGQEVVRIPCQQTWWRTGQKLPRTWCSTLLKADILYSVPPVPSKEENWKAKEKERQIHSLQR